MEKGISIDGTTGELFQVEVLASNDTVTNATALVFEMSLMGYGNVTMTNLVFYPVIQQCFPENVRLSVDNVGMDYHPYGSLLSRIV